MFRIAGDPLWGFRAAGQKASDLYDSAAREGGYAEQESYQIAMVTRVVCDPLTTLDSEPFDDEGKRTRRALRSARLERRVTTGRI